jgi:hypothetical protein
LQAQAAEQRRRYVLGRMLEEEARREHARRAWPRSEAAGLSDEDHVWEMAYFTSAPRAVRRTRRRRRAARRAVVETTLDANLQRTAVAALRRGLVELDERQAYRAPLPRPPPRRFPTRSRSSRSGGFAAACGAEEGAAAETVPPARRAPIVAAASAKDRDGAAPEETGPVWPLASRKGARPIDRAAARSRIPRCRHQVDRQAQSARGRSRPDTKPR